MSTFRPLALCGNLRTVRTGGEEESAKEKLDYELKERGLSVRGLAKLMAARGGKDENHRRNLHRILKGGTPEETTALAVEAALGMPTGWLPRFDPARRSGSADDAERAAVLEILQWLEATVAILAAAMVKAGLLAAEDLPAPPELQLARTAFDNGRGSQTP